MIILGYYLNQFLCVEHRKINWKYPSDLKVIRCCFAGNAESESTATYHVIVQTNFMTKACFAVSLLHYSVVLMTQ